MFNLDENGEYESSQEHFARVKFAGILYDIYCRDMTRSAAISKAAKKAKCRYDGLEVYLPRQKKIQRALRNHAFVKLRASGWSFQWIAEHYGVNEATVRAAISDLRDRLKACERQNVKRVRVLRQKDGWEGKT